MNAPLYHILAVAGGGALGALARYGLSLSFAVVYPGRPYLATLTVNVAGSLVIGFLYVLLVEKALLSALYRPFLMVGLLGAFTTFSTFALDALLLVQNGQWQSAVVYILASLVASILMVTLGYLVGQMVL